MYKWKILYGFVAVFNYWLSPVGWRLFHIILCFVTGISIFGPTPQLIIYFFLYHVALFFVSDKFIFKDDDRERYWLLGQEILQDIRDEMEKLKD